MRQTQTPAIRCGSAHCRGRHHWLDEGTVFARLNSINCGALEGPDRSDAELERLNHASKKFIEKIYRVKIETAAKRLKKLQEGAPSRSDVCSFINDLARSKLISESDADRYADLLADGKENIRPVLRMLAQQIPQP